MHPTTNTGAPAAHSTHAPVTITDPQTHGPRVVREGLPVRSIIYSALAVTCGVLAIAGVATHLVETEIGNIELKTSLWKSCTGGSCSNLDDGLSGCLLHRIRAMRAFGIMSILWAFLICLPLGIADMLRRLPTLKRANMILATAAAILMTFQLIYWSIWAGLWNRGCGSNGAFKDAQGSEWGPSAGLFIASWILSIGMMVLPLVMHAHEPEEKTVTHHVPASGVVDPHTRVAVPADNARTTHPM